ncbi:MAG: ester cyclase [Dehalococcoidales bacterium]|nr:ester cyclase [Dehalococcoidales bacterium]
MVARYSARGTHLGRLLDVPPSGKNIEINGIVIYRLADGKIAEGWFVSSFFNQNGIAGHSIQSIEQFKLFLLEKN